MDAARWARHLWPLIEPIHAVVYFAPEVTAASTAVGVDRSARYFALRAAPMGAVGAEVVAAAFYGFAPERVAAAIPAVWTTVAPADVVSARRAGVDAALARLLAVAEIGMGPGRADDLRRAAELAQAAAWAADDVGARPLTAANRALLDGSTLSASPTSGAPTPTARLWQALTVLREHRGEGHLIGLAHAQVGPVAAHVLRAAAGAADLGFLQTTRGWTDHAIGSARDELQLRGWLDTSGALSAAGRAGRAEIETATDRLGGSPWRGLGDDDSAELARLLRPIADRVVAGCAEAMSVGLGSPWPPPELEPAPAPAPDPDPV